MLTGAILGLARAAGETAAIMFTAAVFYTPKMPDSVFSAVMSSYICMCLPQGTEIEAKPSSSTGRVDLLVLVSDELLPSSYATYAAEAVEV